MYSDLTGALVAKVISNPTPPKLEEIAIDGTAISDPARDLLLGWLVARSDPSQRKK